MKALELYALSYVLNSLWQIPLIFLAAWIASRLARESGPRIEHRIWVSALILETILPGCPIQPLDLWRQLAARLSFGAGSHNGEARIVLGPAIADGAALHFSPFLVAVLLIAYSAVLALCVRAIGLGTLADAPDAPPFAAGPTPGRVSAELSAFKSRPQGGKPIRIPRARNSHLAHDLRAGDRGRAPLGAAGAPGISRRRRSRRSRRAAGA